MSFDDELQRKFDQASSGINLGPASIDAVKKRANKRNQNRKVAMSAAAVLALVVVIGGFAVAGSLSQTEEVASEPETESNLTPDPESNLTPDPERDRVTEADFIYFGAFLTSAEEVNGSTFAFGGAASAFNPFGDPGNTDGLSGSLFLSGHPRQNPSIAEIAIPEPFLHDGTTTGLPVAELVSPFSDITGGRGLSEIGSTDVGGADDFRYGGLEVVTRDGEPRLHWTVRQTNNAAGNQVPSHGHSSLDLANPDPQGPWFLGEEDSRQIAGYVFSVPEEFAEESLDGRSLVSGLKATATPLGGSWGPPFFAYEPPVTGDVGDRLDVEQIAVYPDADLALDGFGEADTAGGAAWITTSAGNSAVVTVGHRGLGEVFAGEPREQDCGIESSVHAGPYEPLVMFYDPVDLAAAAAGDIEPWELEPYRTWNPSEHLIPTCESRLSSISFDAASGRIYVVQVDVEPPDNDVLVVPVIHVFQS